MTSPYAAGRDAPAGEPLRRPPAGEAFMALVITWVLGWGTGAVRAAVAMKGWEWFVADTFDAPQLGFVEAWGFFILVSFATMQLHHGQDPRRPLEVAAHELLSSLLLSCMFFLSLVILAGLR